MSYETKKKDYSGCHPVIAERLQNGYQILCHVWDEHERRGDNKVVHTAYIVDYLKGMEYFPYITEDLDVYTYAEPVSTRQIVKDPLTLMQYFLDNGYHVDNDGDWWKGDGMHTFIPEMWAYCGKEPAGRYDWEPEWLMEV
jgi:hypothetical protein